MLKTQQALKFYQIRI